MAEGQVGLPALYSVGLIFTLLSGMPFPSSVMAVLMQFWPLLAYRTMTKSQRRLFAIHRQRATWARKVQDDGLETEVDIDALTAGDLIAVREAETIPVDGVVTEGLAAVDEEELSGTAGAVDKTPGEAVYASTFVRDGHLTVRVEKIGTTRSPAISGRSYRIRRSITCSLRRKRSASRPAMQSERWR